uniref:Uncharacterized protein n=1 Tax=Romanomermis culicivorax TaxID=13658 RepID=A0A915KLC2_ROMCU
MGNGSRLVEEVCAKLKSRLDDLMIIIEANIENRYGAVPGNVYESFELFVKAIIYRLSHINCKNSMEMNKKVAGKSEAP